MQKNILVVKSNIHFLNQGIRLLSSISDEEYAFNNGKYFKSGIGRHFRHILEHYLSLINGYTDKINYDERPRDVRMETERTFAISTMRSIIDSLEVFIDKPELIDRTLEVQSNEGIEQEDTPWSESSIRRELQFLISHTVHHYALIALILKTEGIETEESFGVAPSTLKHELQQSQVQS